MILGVVTARACVAGHVARVHQIITSCAVAANAYQTAEARVPFEQHLPIAIPGTTPRHNIVVVAIVEGPLISDLHAMFLPRHVARPPNWFGPPFGAPVKLVIQPRQQ